MAFNDRACTCGANAGADCSCSVPETEQQRDSRWYWLDQIKMSVLENAPIPQNDLLRLVNSLEAAWLEIEESPCA